MNLMTFLKQLRDIGVSPKLSFEERKKTRILNICCLVALPMVFFFMVLNFTEGRYTLSVFNAIMVLGNLMFLYINFKQRYQAARLLLSLLSTVFYSLGAFYFHNGTEYYLLLNIIASALLFNKHAVVYGLMLFNGSVFCLVKYVITIHPGIEPVPELRPLVSIVLSTFLIIAVIDFFRREQGFYLRRAETRTARLNHQQRLLLEKKQQLETKTQQLEVLNETKEKLFSIVAHDMRSPIAALKGSLELFNKNIITKEEFQNLSAELTIQVDQLQNNLDNLLQWSHKQLKGIQVHPVEIAVKATLTNVLSLLQTNFYNKKISIETDCPPFLYAYADQEHVNLILRNLVSNAIKFSYVGSRVHIRCFEENEQVLISITDTGKGMEPEMVQQIFNSDHARSTRGTLNEKGTGLGLLLCREFVEKNGGYLMIESEPGKGSTFTISLPKWKKAAA